MKRVIVEKDEQLNILEMMGCRRDHNHRSVDSLASEAIVLPDVSNNGQYDSLTISRVVNQLAENTQRITEYIKEKSDSIGSTNLGNYVTTNTMDENGENKIFVSAPCAMTSQRTLALKNSIDLSINNMPEILASFMMEEYTNKTEVLICVTKPSNGNPSRIIRIDLTSINPEWKPLYNASEDSIFGNADFKAAGYADPNNQYLYVITNKDIRLWNCNYLRNMNILEVNADKFMPCNIVDFYNSFSDDHKRYNDNLVIEDLHRNPDARIQKKINGGNFHEFVDKYFKLGNFPKNVLTGTYYSDCAKYNRKNGKFEGYTGKSVNVYDVGIVTGKYGIYQIQCYSAKSKMLNEFEIDYNEKAGTETGSLHIRCLDDKPVSGAFFYRDKGDLFLVAINGWPKSDAAYSSPTDNKYKGLTVLKLDKSSSASRIYTIRDGETPTLEPGETWDKKLNSNGWIEYVKAKNNINQVLNAKGVNGSYVNRITWAIGTYTINNVKTKGILLKDSARANIPDGRNGWFVPLTDRSLYNVTKAFNRNEFNCLSEFKINSASYYDKQETIVFDIDKIGIVEGNKTSDRDNKTGFRFSILRKDIYGLNQLFLMNNCFVGLDETHIYFITSSGDFNSITLGVDLSTSLRKIEYGTSFENSNTLCLGNGNKITLLYLKYRIETAKYTDLITGDLTKLIKSNFLDGNNIVSKALENHIATSHGPDSVITKLNELIAMLKGKSILESTGFSENNHMSYVILNYPNNGDDFEYVTTNENSTDMYGRINSKTVNADLKLVTELRRNSDAISYYDTVLDTEGNELFSTNVLTYSICRLSSIMTKINVNIPTTGTFYVDNVIGWSNGSRSGSSLKRKNLNGGYLHGKIESGITKYQLVLNRNYFNIKNVLNVTASLASAPLKVYSNKTEFDSRHYGMYDSPIIAPLNTNVLDENMHYDISRITNDEITLDFTIFGGDSLQLSILVQNN